MHKLLVFFLSRSNQFSGHKRCLLAVTFAIQASAFAFGQTVVTIDPDNVPVVNGQRTFLYGAYRDPSDQTFIFDGLNEAQFNLVHSYNFETLPFQTEVQKDFWIEQATVYLDRAAENNKGVFLGLPRDLIIDHPNPAWLSEIVNAVKDKPALYFWQLFDEPSNVTFQNPTNLQKLQNAYNTIKAADSNHPVQVVDAFRLNEVDTYSDIISGELYPIRSDNIFTINDDDEGLMRSVRDFNNYLGQAPNSPFTTTLQGHDWRISLAISQGMLDQINIDGTNYRPNPQEIRAQTHLAIALGLYSPSFFWNDSSAYDLQIEAPEIWQAFVDLGAELNRLGGAIVSTSPVPPVSITPILDPSRAAATPADVDIFSWSRMRGEEMVVSLVNPGDWAVNDVVDVEIDLPLAGFEKVSLFQGDTVLTKINGNWQLNPAASGIDVLNFDGQTLLVRTDYADTLILQLTSSDLSWDMKVPVIGTRHSIGHRWVRLTRPTTQPYWGKQSRDQARSSSTNQQLSIASNSTIPLPVTPSREQAACHYENRMRTFCQVLL